MTKNAPGSRADGLDSVSAVEGVGAKSGAGAGATELVDFDLALQSYGLTPLQVRQIHDYLLLLGKWNRVYNLSAMREVKQMQSHHVLDCLDILRPIDRWWGRETAGPELAIVPQPQPSPIEPATPRSSPPLRILDVGSGAGLPGIVLAIARPDWRVLCVDAVGKKTAFIQQVALALGLKNLGAQHSRIEHIKAQSDDEQFHLITSRAFADLRDFVSLSRHLLRDGGRWMAMKGKLPTEELQTVSNTAGVQLLSYEKLDTPHLNHAERHLIWLEAVGS